MISGKEELNEGDFSQWALGKASFMTGSAKGALKAGWSIVKKSDLWKCP